MATALAALMSLPSLRLAVQPSPVHRLERLERTLGPSAPRLFVKRDDLLSFGGGGNKVRKLDVIGAEAARAGCDTLITCGAVQSNHARVTAAAGAVLGCRVVLVLSGDPVQPPPAGNLARDYLFGADVRFVRSRDERDPLMQQIAADVQTAGGRPYVIPAGGSTPLGAMGFARGVGELSAAGLRPDAIVHASSSAATQAGLIAGCALFGLKTRVIGISADEPSATLSGHVTNLLDGIAARLGAKVETIGGAATIEVDDAQVGPGYGVTTEAGEEAAQLVARREGMLLDPVYTAKAMAGVIARVRAGVFGPDQTVMFWHTGGLA